MLEYEWGNPSSIMLTGDEPGQEPDPNRPVYDPYNPPTQQQQQQQQFPENNSFVVNPDPQFAPVSANPHHNNLPFTHFTSFYDSRAYGSASSYPHHAQPASMLSLEPGGPAGYMVVPKSEPMAGGFDYNHSNRSASADQFHSRLGLNLGGRTYFASSEDDFVSRLYRRSRILEPGSVNSPKCQAEGCNADLSHAKHYHRRHKVCEFHSKAAAVIAAGLTQRFCQQCSRFHLLSEFDNGKRSCRKRLADHNRRRRKSQQSNNQESSSSSSKAHQLDSSSAPNSSSENLSKSPPDSRQHSSSVTVALSPPRMSLDCFGRRSYTGGGTSSSTASTSSLFYSNR